MCAVDVRTPRWSSSSFLLYEGGLTVLAAAAAALGILSDDYRDAAFAGWSALVVVGLATIAAGLGSRDRWIAAGVLAAASVVAFAVFVGALERWFGWLPRDGSVFGGFHVGRLLLALLTVAAASVALAALRFPLLVFTVAVPAWYFVTDLVSGGGDWSAVVTFLVGLAFLLAGRTLDRGPRRAYAFWLHVAAGLAVGGSLLFLWHKSDAEWALVIVAGLVYVGLAAALGRSSYAVLGTIGILLGAAHFAGEWARTPFFTLLGSRGRVHDWVWPLVYAVVGFGLLALGLGLERRGTRDAS